MFVGNRHCAGPDNRLAAHIFLKEIHGNEKKTQDCKFSDADHRGRVRRVCIFNDGRPDRSSQLVIQHAEGHLQDISGGDDPVVRSIILCEGERPVIAV